MRAILMGVLALMGAGCLLDPCLADNERCEGRSKVTLVSCEATPEDTLALEDLSADVEGLVDTTVTVVGPLRTDAGNCTQLGCATEGGCCNSCGSGYMLSNNAEAAFLEPGDLGLSGSVQGVLLACGGDESLLCCPVPGDGRKVQVTGRLQQIGANFEGSTFSMTIQSMCTLP